MSVPTVFLFSDFGSNGPYVGQVEAVLKANCSANFIDLLNDAPVTDPFHASYLLAAIYRHLPTNDGYLMAVVDPGVGSNRHVVLIRTERMTIIAPDNGLAAVLANYHNNIAVYRLIERPSSEFVSFHARDWFAPLIANLINGAEPLVEPINVADMVGAQTPDQLHEVIYIDHYGNLMTGIQADKRNAMTKFQINQYTVVPASTFSDVPHGELFWYENSIGLVEIAANSSSAAEIIKARIGDKLYEIDALDI